MRTLQIGMTASRRHISGTDRYFFSLMRALPQHGITVRGVVLGDPKALDDPVAGIESFAPEGAGRWQRWTGLRRSICRWLPESDLVVSHNAAHAFPAIDALRRRPVVVHFHGPWALEGRAERIGLVKELARRFQERSVYARGVRFIVLSHAFGQILQREYAVDPATIRVVPGGVDVDRFLNGMTRAAARARLGWPTDRPIVATVRRLVPTKGLDRFVDAVAQLRRNLPDVLAMVIGTGPLADNLRQRTRDHSCEGNVRFAGHIPDSELAHVYRAADLVVVPSVALEGFGLTVVEALASGTPVLVTPVGGLPEVVCDLDPALVLPSAESHSMAGGMRDALMGTVPLPSPQACTDYAMRFSWLTIAKRVRDVYAEAA